MENVIIFCLLMCLYVSCVYFCRTWCELTLWFITFTLTHGAVVGHQRAQSWAHLLRSHNQDTCLGLSSWVLSVRVWRHIKKHHQGIVYILVCIPSPAHVRWATHHGHCWPALPVDPRPWSAGLGAGLCLQRCRSMGGGLEDAAHETLCYPSRDLDPVLALCLSFACDSKIKV